MVATTGAEPTYEPIVTCIRSGEWPPTLAAEWSLDHGRCVTAPNMTPTSGNRHERRKRAALAQRRNVTR